MGSVASFSFLRRGYLVENVINVTNGPSNERTLRTGGSMPALLERDITFDFVVRLPNYRYGTGRGQL